MFGLASWKAFDSFRHDLAGISRFSADAHRHQVFSWTVFQAGWSLVSFTPWAFGQDHLSLGCEFDYSVTQHSPLCTNCLWWVLILPFMMFYVFLYLLCRSYVEKKRHEIQVFNYFSLHWCGAWGDIWGKLALRAGGRRQNVQNMPGPLSIPGEKCELTVYHMQVESL